MAAHNQMVCNSGPGGSSERLTTLCPLAHRYMSDTFPLQHWRPRKGCAGPGGGGWLRDPQGLSHGKWDWKGHSRYGWQRAGD